MAGVDARKSDEIDFNVVIHIFQLANKRPTKIACRKTKEKKNRLILCFVCARNFQTGKKNNCCKPQWQSPQNELCDDYLVIFGKLVDDVAHQLKINRLKNIGKCTNSSSRATEEKKLFKEHFAVLTALFLSTNRNNNNNNNTNVANEKHTTQTNTHQKKKQSRKNRKQQNRKRRRQSKRK